MPRVPKRETWDLRVRLDPELRDALQRLAEREDRSLNNLINHLLRRAVGQDEKPAH